MNNDIITFLIHNEYRALIAVVHTKEELIEIANSRNWHNIQVWKNNVSQDILLGYRYKKPKDFILKAESYFT